MLVTAVLSYATKLIVSGSSLATAPDVPWAQPTEIALHNAGPVALSGLEREQDCTPLSYRLRDDISKTMRDGCFVPTSFGMLDPERSVIIFNGTDEAMPLKYAGQTAALMPLPYSASVARFGGFPTVGTYMYLYPNFPDYLEEYGTPLSGRYKEITAQPSFVVRDGQGRQLAVNSTAINFAARGQWMITESPNKALIRVNLATFSIEAFAPAFQSPGSPLTGHAASMAITESGRYAAVASNEFKTFNVYDLKNCPGGDINEELTPKQCPVHDYWPVVKVQVTGTLQRVSRVRFVHDGIISFDATTSTGTETYLLSPDGIISSLIPFLGLGDSFASGQGAFNYRPGTDTTINKCHLSIYAYPLRLNASLFGGRGNSVACSGARIHDIGTTSPNYTGQASDQKPAHAREADGSSPTILHDFLPGYLAQQQFVTSYQPGVITVQIGGNDIGFGDVLRRCVSPITSLKPPVFNPNNCYGTYEDRYEVAQTVDRQYSRWVQLYRQLQKQSPLSRIYAIGYPHIVSSAAVCGVNTPLTLDEVGFARELTDYLNGVIQKAARAAGVTYVDIRSALAGKELCSGHTGQAAVNGITAGNDALGILGQESFHPTAYGHDLIEQAIRLATSNFAPSVRPIGKPSEPAPAIQDSHPFVQKPRAGRSVRNVIPTRLLAGRVKKGATATINLNGYEYGLKPGGEYVIRINDVVVGNTTSDSQGNITAPIVIPPSSLTGTQPVTVDGAGQGGQPITIIDVIDIPGDGSAIVTPTAVDQPVGEAGGSFDTDKQMPIVSLEAVHEPRRFEPILSVTRPTAAVLGAQTSRLRQAGDTNITASAQIPHPPLARFEWYKWLLAFILLLLAAHLRVPQKVHYNVNRIIINFMLYFKKRG